MGFRGAKIPAASENDYKNSTHEKTYVFWQIWYSCWAMPGPDFLPFYFYFLQRTTPSARPRSAACLRNDTAKKIKELSRCHAHLLHRTRADLPTRSLRRQEPDGTIQNNDCENTDSRETMRCLSLPSEQLALHDPGRSESRLRI